MKAKAFDTRLFKRILQYTKPYKSRMYGVILFAVLLSIFAALRPYLLKQTVDGYIKTQDKLGLLNYIILMAVVLILEVLSNFFFTFWANWLGQDIVKDIRIKLFKHMLSFKMKYYEDLKYTDISESLAMSFDTMMGLIGGQFGLYMGASFLSFVEIFEMFINLGRLFIKYRNKKRVVKLQVLTKMGKF